MTNQRPERQGPMHTLIVGRPYSPSRRSWHQGADYNVRAGGHELRVFLGHATPREITAVRTGKAEFGLMIELPELFVVSRFHGPDDQVVASFDCSYQWHRVSAEERTEPPAWKETSPRLRALATIVLVEATTGVVLALRSCSYSPEFTRSLHRAIADQAVLPYDQSERRAWAWALAWARALARVHNG